MKSLLRSAVLTATLIALAVVSVPFATRILAQTALTATTLSAALALPAGSAAATVVNLTSGTGVSAGVGLYVDAEYMTVQSAGTATTIWNVVRGQGGTAASAHASGAVAWIGATNNFYRTDVSGPCTSTAEQALPHINVNTGTLFNCVAVNTLAGSTASTWARYIEKGLPAFQLGRYTGWTYVTLGALTIQPGVQFIGSSGALAMTLAAPDKYMDGLVMVLMASTAQAHTVTYTAGFFGTTTSSDVATYGGAIGDQLTIIASNGVWRPVSSRNVTIA